MGGEEGEGEPIDFVRPHPDPPPSKVEGIYREDSKYLWLDFTPSEKCHAGISKGVYLGPVRRFLLKMDISLL